MSQELYIIWLLFMVHMCKMIIFLGIFSFFQNYVFLGRYWEVKGGKTVQNNKKIHFWVVKQQKMAQNDKMFCLLCLVSGIIIIWSLFMIHTCKQVISLGIFYSVCLYRRNHTSEDCNFWYTWVKWWYLQHFFYSFKILIFWIFREVKGQKWPKITNFSLSWSISQEL